MPISLLTAGSCLTLKEGMWELKGGSPYGLRLNSEFSGVVANEGEWQEVGRNYWELA